MMDIAIASHFAKDKMERQFAAPPRRPAAPVATVVAAAPRRAPVRRAAVYALRVLADRIEPTPRCARA
jgi:hypothetical protein